MEGHELNLIDTPGHVDFTYEVSRPPGVRGAVLVVDAAQGVEAQTVANAYLAIENDLELLPLVNKIDLPQADPEGGSVSWPSSSATCPTACCACRRRPVRASRQPSMRSSSIPPPSGDPRHRRAPSSSTPHTTSTGASSHSSGSSTASSARERARDGPGNAIRDRGGGFFAPTMQAAQSLAGEVGYIVTGLKDAAKLRVGDTLTSQARPAAEPLPGYKDVKPMVFAALYPTDSDDYPQLRDALERLKLNDASLSYEPETSQALGFGFRCGFLGLLHMEIVRERLEREFDLDLLVCADRRLQGRDAGWRGRRGAQPASCHGTGAGRRALRPRFDRRPEGRRRPGDGACNERRGRFDHMEYPSPERVLLVYELPLAEIVFDFYDQLKSRTSGYASFDYDFAGFRKASSCDWTCSSAVSPSTRFARAPPRRGVPARPRALVDRLRQEIPRQMFDVPVQAAIGSRIIARETIKAKRKDVLAKCYGGDITRKRKLLERQKAGKRRMKQVGAVEVPQEAFLAVLNLDDAKR